MIKTKCLFAPPEEEDGIRIVVSYKLPSKGYLRTHNAIWEPNLAPDPTTVKAYKRKKNGITWKQYTEKYLAKMKSASSTKAIDKWATVSLIETITLLCYEGESNPHCHRHLLKTLIDERVIVIQKESRRRKR